MNQNSMIHDPSLRQYQLERSRGNIVNMPANVFSQPPPFLPQPIQQPVYPQPRYQIWGLFDEISEKNVSNFNLDNCNSWSVGFPLSATNNSPTTDQQIYELLQQNPTLPLNASPSKVIFVYDVPPGHYVIQDSQLRSCYIRNKFQNQNQNQPVTHLSNKRVVRIDRETQTESGEAEHAKGVADNREILHKAIRESATKAPTITSNLSEPDKDEIHSAVCKVNNWFQMTEEIVSNGSRSRSEEPLSDERSITPNPTDNLPMEHQTSQQPHQLHGSQSSGNFKKPAVRIVRHSVVESKNEAKEAKEADVVGDGDDNETGRTATKRDSEKGDDTNNVSLVGELSVAEKCSESDATETDINTHSHDDVNESQEGASIPKEPNHPEGKSSD
ncbi:hypothetical protein CRE_05978 [Caenorhabditis remanei]|uniref:Uncharacterized protein n=1 Tax=Caenorhabditis remanei TaxID=31234 RepID=E3MZC8_CAERE|nr:hypothetical protein CRE_05978 [Caenorhabditis remanei]